MTSPLELRPQEEENYIATTESELAEHSDADRDEDSAGEACVVTRIRQTRPEDGLPRIRQWWPVCDCGRCGRDLRLEGQARTQWLPRTARSLCGQDTEIRGAGAAGEPANREAGGRRSTVGMGRGGA